MIIIGSTAIKYHFPDFKREPKDLDIAIRSLKEKPSVTQFRANPVEYLLNPILYDAKHLKHQGNYLSKDGLLTLKMSHLFWDTNWDKHMFDVQFLLEKGCQMDETLFFELVEFWKDYLPKIKRSNLVMSKEDFFTNAINYDEHEHDSLHTLINPSPMYLKLLKDGYEVELDENKFHMLSFEEKLEVVREETYVMAYERYKKIHYIPAFKRMLDKFIMKHAPIYIAIFAILNYKELLKPKFNYIKQIEDGLHKVK
jgi:hypothetical protein